MNYNANHIKFGEGKVSRDKEIKEMMILNMTL